MSGVSGSQNRVFRVIGSPFGILALVLVLMFLLSMAVTRCCRSPSYLTRSLMGNQKPHDILEASRELLLRRNNGEIPTNSVTVEATGIRVSGEIVSSSSWVPRSVRALEPRYIWIRQDYVLIALDTPGRRTALLAFREGTEESGTVQVIGGLWYWNGQ